MILIIYYYIELKNLKKKKRNPSRPRIASHPSIWNITIFVNLNMKFDTIVKGNIGTILQLDGKPIIANEDIEGSREFTALEGITHK